MFRIRLLRACAITFTLATLWMLSTATPAAQAAPAPVSTNGSPDPNADNFSPVAWNQAWNPVQADYDELRNGDLQTGLEQTGLVVPELFASLTASDRQELSQAWKTRGLVRKVWDQTSLWHDKALVDTANVPQWSSADSDSIAQKLGGRSYADLTPGLKAVVQRVALIVTGDKKPPMADGAWQSWMPPESKRAWDVRLTHVSSGQQLGTPARPK